MHEPTPFRPAPVRAALAVLAAGAAASLAGTLVDALDGAGRSAWADAGSVAFHPFAIVAILLLLRSRVLSLSSAVTLDGVLAVLAAGALAAAAGGTVPVAADLALLAVVIWAATLAAPSGRRVWAVLAAGALALLLADALVAGGADGVRALRAALPAVIVLAVAAVWRPPTAAHRVRIDSLAVLALPSVSIALALGLLIAGLAVEVAEGADALALLVLSLAMVRGVLTYRELDRIKEGRRFLRGFEDASIGMALISRDLRWVRVNGALCAMLGRAPGDLVGRPIREAMHPEESADPAAVTATMEPGDRVDGLDRTYLAADGRRVETLVTSVLVQEDGDEPYFFSQIQDVTERNRARRHSAALAELGGMAVELSEPGVLVPHAMDVVARVLAAEACALERGGPPGVEHGRVRIALHARAETLVAARETRFDADERRFLQAAADVLAGALNRADAEASTRRQALEDPLTGLANRAFLTAHVERELGAARRGEGAVALVLLDLDRFKDVNDTLGHAAGDELLRQVAARLRERMRSGDVVARLGGDEFVVAGRQLQGEEDAPGLAQRVVAVFAEPFVVAGRELVVRPSVGVAVAAGAEPASAEGLLGDADVAMYRAKDLGGGRFEIFDAELRSRVVRRLELELALRDALDRDELDLHFQPFVRLADERVLGFEALLRWRHPQHGLVAPDQFVPIAEETDLIRPIGAWVLERACRQIGAWNARRPAGDPLRLSVNLSARQLTPDLVGTVLDVLDRTGTAPSTVVLEITEGLLVKGDEAREVLAALRALGCGVALDDFGTGYSSLGSVADLALDVVKLDRSLIAGLGSSDRAEGLVRAAVGMAESLGLSVLAEGLERPEQVRVARELGCAYGQGWYWSRALDADQAEALLSRPGESPPDRDPARPGA